MFQFTQPKRAATTPIKKPCSSEVFQFTQPKRAATQKRGNQIQQTQFQFTQPKRAATRPSVRSILYCSLFQFTQPKRAATDGNPVWAEKWTFQFTQPKRAATVCVDILQQSRKVSIHAAQAGCDKQGGFIAFAVMQFQFTQPKRAATTSCRIWRIISLFQFTQPKRAATSEGHIFFDVDSFNSRSPSGLRLRKHTRKLQELIVSIHAAQAGCDTALPIYSTTDKVSIHAAQAGCDMPRWHNNSVRARFNSRSPSGLRRRLGAFYL